MVPVPRNAREGGDSGLSKPITAVVCFASVVVGLTLGVLAWRFIVWRRNKGAPPSPTSTKISLSPTTILHLPRKPEPAHKEKGLDYTYHTSSPPPAYSLGPMEDPSASPKKSTPALNLDVSCEAVATLPSPHRSASFNPSTKTQSTASRTPSRVSVDAKKLPRLMTVSVLYIPSLSDELPIRLGETIRMIEEYEDEWCLVQRVGRTDERGVIPRFCLTERQEIIPRTGKRISGGFFQTSTFRK